MKLEEAYARATKSAIEHGTTTKVAFDNLLSILKNRGHMTLLPRIKNHLIHLEEERIQRETPKIKVARQSDTKKFKNEIAAACKELDIIDPVHVEDGTLVGGYVVEGNDMVVDASYKTTLLKLYRSFIS